MVTPSPQHPWLFLPQCVSLGRLTERGHNPSPHLQQPLRLRQLHRHDLADPTLDHRHPEQPVHAGHVIALWVMVTERVSEDGEGKAIDLTKGQNFGGRDGGYYAGRERRRTSSATTRASASPRRLGSFCAGRGSSASMRRTTSCIARSSPFAARLASCLAAASSLVMLRWRPFSFTATFSLSAAATAAPSVRARLRDPRGLPDWPGRKRVASGGRR